MIFSFKIRYFPAFYVVVRWPPQRVIKIPCVMGHPVVVHSKTFKNNIKKHLYKSNCLTYFCSSIFYMKQKKIPLNQNQLYMFIRTHPCHMKVETQNKCFKKKNTEMFVANDCRSLFSLICPQSKPIYMIMDLSAKLRNL
jgi:hypothetical protein